MKDERISTELDFILAPKFGNSLTAFLERYPEGVPPAAAARALGIPEPELILIRDQALSKMRELI